MKSYVTEKHNTNSIFSILFVIVATIIILLIRKTDALTNPQFWAEDGTIFFLQQYYGSISTLLQEYAGYLHLIPRLIALIGDTFIPYSSIPAFYNYTSLLIILVVTISIFSSRFHVKHKNLIALTILLVPHYENEVFLNITNTTWVLSIMLILVLLKDNPSTRYRNVSIQYTYDLVIIAICGLTGPFIVFLMPFFGWKWANKKDIYNTVILATAGIISLIQLSFIVPYSMNSYNISTNFAAYSAVIGHKVFGGLFLGSNIAYKINHYILSFLYFSFLILILYFAYQKNNTFTFFFIGISLIYLLAAFYRFKDSPGVLISPGNGPRYFYIPYIMMTWSLIVLLGQQEKWKNLLLKVGLTLILISSLTSHFHSKPFIDYNWPSYSQSIGKKDIIIPINPAGWQITVKAHAK